MLSSTTKDDNNLATWVYFILHKMVITPLVLFKTVQVVALMQHSKAPQGCLLPNKKDYKYNSASESVHEKSSPRLEVQKGRLGPQEGSWIQ